MDITITVWVDHAKAVEVSHDEDGVFVWFVKDDRQNGVEFSGNAEEMTDWLFSWKLSSTGDWYILRSSDMQTIAWLKAEVFEEQRDAMLNVLRDYDLAEAAAAAEARRQEISNRWDNKVLAAPHSLTSNKW